MSSTQVNTILFKLDLAPRWLFTELLVVSHLFLPVFTAAAAAMSQALPDGDCTGYYY